VSFVHSCSEGLRLSTFVSPWHPVGHIGESNAPFESVFGNFIPPRGARLMSRCMQDPESTLHTMKIFLRSPTSALATVTLCPYTKRPRSPLRRRCSPLAWPTLRYGSETKRLKVEDGLEVEALIEKFREKFGLKPEDKPHKGALYMVTLPPIIVLPSCQCRPHLPASHRRRTRSSGT
jgi:hypothetical protein